MTVFILAKYNNYISEYSNKALNRPIFAASGMVNSEGVLVDGNRLPNVITSKYVHLYWLTFVGFWS